MAEPQRTQAPTQKLDLSQQALAKPARSMQTIQALFSDRSVVARIAAVIPKHLTPERLLKVIVSSIAKTPKLLECSQMSLLQAAIAMSELGLEPDAVRGLAYLVPYKGTCQLIIGYRGFIELARRSGGLKQIEARLVREKDKLDVKFGLEPRFEHVPFLDGDAGPVKLVYGIARFTDGGEHIEVMTVQEVEAIRKRSRAATGGPWVTDWEAMAKKTVIRQLAKWLPLSPEMVKAIEIDDEQFVDGAKILSSPSQATPPTSPPPALVADTVVDFDVASPSEAFNPVTGEVLDDAPTPAQQAAQPAAADAPQQSGQPELSDDEKELAAELEATIAFIRESKTKTELRKLIPRIQSLPEFEKNQATEALEARMKELGQ